MKDELATTDPVIDVLPITRYRLKHALDTHLKFETGSYPIYEDARGIVSLLMTSFQVSPQTPRVVGRFRLAGQLLSLAQALLKSESI